MAQYHFGAGELKITPSGGNTAITVGTLQDVSLDISGTTKKLMGANRFPVDVAIGPTTVSGKAKHAQLQGDLIAAALGTTVATGTVTLDNQLMGAGSVFKVEWNGTFRGKAGSWTLNACVFPKLGLSLKNEDYTTVDLEFEAFADDAGHVLTFTAAE